MGRAIAPRLAARFARAILELGGNNAALVAPTADLDLADLPGAWADGMKALVGVVPPDDKDGCLQDIHWPGGAWGYFPTYTMGAMTAVQLFDAASRALPELPDAIRLGDFVPLLFFFSSSFFFST